MGNCCHGWGAAGQDTSATGAASTAPDRGALDFTPAPSYGGDDEHTRRFGGAVQREASMHDTPATITAMVSCAVLAAVVGAAAAW